MRQEQFISLQIYDNATKPTNTVISTPAGIFGCDKACGHHKKFMAK